jgi:hypothetical protein
VLFNDVPIAPQHRDRLAVFEQVEETEHDYTHSTHLLLDPAQHGQPVHARQMKVEQHKIGWLVPDVPEAIPAVGRLTRDPDTGLRGQDLSDECTDVGISIGNQYVEQGLHLSGIRRTEERHILIQAGWQWE